MDPSRRSILKAGAASAVILSGGAFVKPAFAAESLRVLDSGGRWQVAAKKAFYDPFEQETGVQVVAASGLVGSGAQFKAIMQAGGPPPLDLLNNGMQSLIRSANEGLLEPLDYSVIKTDGFLPDCTHPYACATDIVGWLMLYNKQKFSPDKAPKTMADFWNPEKFPGRRCMGNQPLGMLEFALMADGTPKDKLYPIDYDRAFRKLDQIKSHIVWWTAYAQQTQFVVDGEVDLILGLNGRFQAAIDGGAPYAFAWTDALLGREGFGIPKGVPPATKAAAMKFIALTARPKAQAMFADEIGYGPANAEAFKLMKPRSDLVPSDPSILKSAVMRNEVWWAENEAIAANKWTEWRAK